MIRGRKPITRDTAQQPGEDEFTRAAAPPVDGACACGTAVAQRSPVLDAAQAVAYCTAEAQRTRSLRVMVSWAASPAGRPSAAARSTAVRRLVKAPLPGWGAEAPGCCPFARPGSGSRCRLLRWRVRWRCRSRSRGSGRRPEAGPGARLHLDAYDRLTSEITVLDQLVAAAAEPFEAVIARLLTIPGIGPRIAQVIVAETGGDMARFASSSRLAAWAGLAPGDNESAGKRKKAAARKGNPHLKSAMVEGAWLSPAPPAVPAPGSAGWPTGSAGSTSRRPPSRSPTPCCASPGRS